MLTLRDHRSRELFDPWEHHGVKRRRLLELSWAGVLSVTTGKQPLFAAPSSFYSNSLSVPSDFRFMNRFTLFNDAELVALICPRAHQIQAGSKDNASHRETGNSIVPRSAAYFEKLNLKDRFQHVVFEGGHEFDDASAWAFVEKHL